MSIANTLRLLTKAAGVSPTDLATAIPRAGVNTVSAWLKGEKLPGRDQIDAIARALGVPAGALLAELASTLDPARTQGEHQLLAAYRALNPKQQGALLEVARSMAMNAAAPAAATPKTARKSAGRPRAPGRARKANGA